MKNNIDCSGTLAITGVNIIDVLNKTILENRTIISTDGIIKDIGSSEIISIPDKANVLNLSGMFIIPGLIDAHVHLALSGIDEIGRINTEPMIKRYLRNSDLTLKSGVTTVRNMPGSYGYSILKFRDKVNEGKYIAPRIFASGPALSAPYGYFSIKGYAPPVLLPLIKIIFGAHGLSVDVETLQDVPKVIKKLKKASVDFIKTVTPGSIAEMYPKLQGLNVNPRILDANMKPDLLKAIVKCAHDEGLKVAAHLFGTPKGFNQAVEAGVDSIEHTPLGLIDDGIFEKMKETGVYWVPTAYCFLNWVDLIDNPEKFNSSEIKNAIPEPYYSIGKKILDKQRKTLKSGNNPNAILYAEMPKYKQQYFPVNFKNAIKAGVKIVASVDAGAGGASWVPHGFLFKELELFVQHGMNEYEAIQTATANAAELLGIFDKLGSIELGKIADFVILNANPLKDISNLRQVEYVIKDGKIVYSGI